VHFANRCPNKIDDKMKEEEEVHHTQSEAKFLLSSCTEYHPKNFGI